MENIAQLGIKVDSTGIKQATNELSKLSGQSGKTEQSTAKLSSIFSKANIAITAIGASIAYVTKQGITYNATIEKLTNGLTTLNALTSSNVDNFGKQLSIQDKYNIAARESVETIAQLNKINLETPHTLKETVQIYKSMYTSMRSVGVTSEQMIDLTKKLSIAAGSNGIEFQQLLAGIDGLATGTVEAGSELGRFLKSMGLGNEVLKSSTNIYETLNNKFKDVKGIIGYEEEISNLENSFDQLTGALVAPFFDDVKRGIHGLSSMFTDLTQSVTIFYDKFKSISELSTTDQLNKRAVEVTERIAEIQKDLANPSFFQSTGKLNAELRASNLELLSINDQFNKMNKLSEQKTVSTGIDRNESEIIKLAGSELSKFNLQLEDNVNKLKKVGATESEINKFRADQLKEFNEKQNKSLDEQNKKLEDTQKAYTQIAQIGMSQYDKSIASITEQTKEWLKVGVDSNTVLQAELDLKKQLNTQTLLENLKEELSYYEKKLQLQKDSLDKELELKGVQYANNILAIESSDKTIEQKEKLIALETELYDETVKRLKADNNAEFQDTLKSFQEDSLARQIELNNAIFDFGAGFKSSNSEIMEVSKSLAAMSDASLKSKKAETELNKKYTTEFTKYAGDVEKTKELEQQYTKDTALLNKQAINNQILGYANIAGAISGMFQQGSREAATFQAAQTVLALVEGTRAILTAGTGDPYTAIPRMAAMAIMVKSLLGNIGVSLGMSGSNTTTGDSFSMQKANTGSGSVLGDTSKASESITKSLSILEDYAKPEFRLSQQMSKSLESIDSKIGGVTALLLQNSATALGTNYTGGFDTGYKNNLNIDTLINPINAVISKIPVIGQINNLFGGIINSAIGGIFGKTSVSQSLEDSGITFADAYLKDAINQLNGSAYQTIKTTTNKKSWFHSSSSTSLNTYFTGLDASVNNQFSLVLRNLYDTVYQAGNALDIGSDSLNNSLNNFVVSIGKISLKDKNGTQIQELLTSIFGKIGDDLATSVVPVITQFQKVGEGSLTTLVRVANGMEQANYYIDRLGTTFQKINFNEIINKQGDVGFEALYQSILKVEKGANFNNVLSTLNGTAEELYSAYIALDLMRDRLTFLGKGLDGLSISAIIGAGGLEQLSDGISSFIENFYSSAEQQQLKVSELNQELSRTGITTIPTTIQGFKDLVNGINTTTESGQKLYGSLISLSDSFYDVYSSIEDERKALTERLQDTKALTDSEKLLLTRQRELSTYTDLTSISILNQIYAQEDLNTKNEKANELLQNQISNRSSLIDNLSNFVKSIDDSIIKDTTFKDFSNSFNGMIDAIKLGSGDLSDIGDATIETAQSYLDTVSRTAKSSAEIEFAKKIVANKFEGVINAKDITLGTINDTLKISFNEDSAIVKAINDVKNELVYLNQLNTRQTANSNKTLQLQRASIA